WIPSHMLYLADDRRALEIREFHPFRSNYCQIAVAQKKKIASVIKNRRHIGSDKIFVFAKPYYGRWAVAGSDNFVGLVYCNHRKCKDSRELFDCLAHCLFEGRAVAIVVLEVIILDKVGDDFCVGFCGELMSFFDQFSF